MSHSIGAVKFPTGEIRYYEYNGTSDVVCTRLHVTQESVRQAWRKDTDRDCTCGRPPVPVEICTTYGGGFTWSAEACLQCGSVVSGLAPEEEKDHLPSEAVPVLPESRQLKP